MMRAIYLYQKFFYAGRAYYWREKIDYLPPEKALFTPMFGDRGRYHIQEIVINHGIRTAFVYLEPLRITMPYSPEEIEKDYPMEVMKADEVEYHWDVDTDEQIKGLYR